MKKTLAAISLIALLSGAAFAEAGKITANLLPGIAIPVGGRWASDKGNDPTYGSYDYGYKASFAAAISVDYQFHEMFAGGLELGYNFNHKLKADVSGFSGANERILQITPYIRAMTKKIGDKWTPYGVLGMGLYSMKMTDEKDLSTGQIHSTAAAGYFGFNLGGGLMYDAAKDIQVGLDLRWHHIFSKNSEGDTMAVNNCTPSVKISYLFK